MPQRADAVQILGSRIKQARQRQGISQAQLAAMVSTSRTYLSQIECGVARNVSYRLARRLYDVLGFSTEMPEDIPAALACYAECESLSPDEVRMLLYVKVRGQTPETAAQYRFVHKLLEAAVLNIDGVPEP